MRKVAIAIIVPLLTLVLLSACVAPWAAEIPLKISTGWINYVVRTIPHVRVNVSAVALFALVLSIVLQLSHRLAKWLWSGIGKPGHWQWKWTVTGIAGLMLMFVAGMAATGVVHQTGWLINSPERLTRSSFSGRHQVNRIKCASHLRQFYVSIRTYAAAHPGFRPETMKDIVEAEMVGLDARTFICPATDEEPAPASQPTELRAQLLESDSKYVSYAVSPSSVLGPDKIRHVLLYDRVITNHEDGINILHEDGEILWLDEKDAKQWLQSVESTLSGHRPKP